MTTGEGKLPRKGWCPLLYFTAFNRNPPCSITSPVFTIFFFPLFSLQKKRKREEGDAPPPSRRWCGGAKRPRRRVVVFFERRREQQQRRTGKEEAVRARPASREKTTDDDVRGRESPKLSTRKRFGYRDEEDANLRRLQQAELGEHGTGQRGALDLIQRFAEGRERTRDLIRRVV